MAMKKILVVDDEPDIRKYLLLRLKKKGYAVASAQCGMEALERLHQDPPDLVLLDIKMPRLSGYDVLREMRKDESLKSIPVIFVTAHADTRSEREDDVEADDLLLKPFEIEELFEKIEKHTRKGGPTALSREEPV